LRSISSLIAPARERTAESCCCIHSERMPARSALMVAASLDPLFVAIVIPVVKPRVAGVLCAPARIPVRL